jgi:predicted DNA-binding protein (MmcQ/YjbR family)
VYKAADKVFQVVTDDPDEQIITVKCEPEHTRALERGSPERRPYEPLLPNRLDDRRLNLR